MKTSMLKLLPLLAALALPAAHAEDIDIFGGVGGSTVPNVLIAVDSQASNDAEVSPYTCTYAPLSGTSVKPKPSMLTMVQCALYMAVDKITTTPALLGKIRIGLMRAGDASMAPGNHYGVMTIPLTAPWILPLMDTAGVAAFKSAIIPPTQLQSPGNAALGDEMAEAWAFLTGHASPHDPSLVYTNQLGGSLSCQKTYLIVIGNVDNKHNNPSNEPAGLVSDLANARDPTPTSTQLTEIHTDTIGPYTSEDTSTIDMWSRYMYQSDFNGTVDDKQNIVTYGIGTYGIGGVWLDKSQKMQSMANQGGGKYFLVNDLNTLVNDFINIFLEIAAVNSVFASSSLPISSNSQGTYLNQIFIGMFRPDSQDHPRWMGNLKQYQFGVGGTVASPTLFLADKNGNPALNSAGTGFLAPTAVSFWNPDIDTTKLPDSIGGFWTNAPSGAAGGFDNQDGEIVEKGGVGQQIRLATLTADYSQSPGTSGNPRNVYTCTSGCNNGSLLSATPFSTTNASIDATALGITGSSSSVSALTRSGTTATMTLSAAPTPALTSGQAVTIIGAPTEYNGTFNITLVGASTTQFTYTIVESPPTPATASYTASIPGSVASVTTLVRSGTTKATSIATATTTAPHGFVVGQKVTIAGAIQAEYGGVVTITSVPTPTTFTYAITPGPTNATTGGTATVGAVAATITTGVVDTTYAGATFTTTVTLTSSSKLAGAFAAPATVVVTGMAPSAYNGTFTITNTGTACPGGTNNRSLCYTISTSPVSPATGTITADPSAFVVLSGLTHTTSCSGASPSTSVTVTATGSAALPASFVNGATVNITGSPGTRENAYLGSFTIANVNTGARTFDYGITSSPSCAPSTAGISVLTSASSIDRDSLIHWIRGDDNLGDEASPDPGTITIRPSVHGDTLHSRPSVVNYPKASGIGVVVFYGSNDGVFHAVNGNQPLNGNISIGSVGPGGEIWGFIPTEFYTKFKRLYANSPPVALASLSSTVGGITTAPKDYFFDGSTGVFQDDSAGIVDVFLSARRGGRLLYGLDVSNPSTPKFMWKKTNADTGLGELGYTWSTPKAARLRGYVDGSGNPIPVVIMGAGYDPNEDNEPPTADTMGRGIFILDATDGHVVWSVTHGAGATGTCSGTCTLTDMTYAIPGDITLVNRDGDVNGYIDRLYGVDLGGNIWRVDLEPAGYSAAVSAIGPSTWTVTKFASLGGSGTTKRKFFYPPDIVPTKTFDMILDGTGDREHPLYSTSSTQAYSMWQRFYGLKDYNTGSSVPSGYTTITDSTDAATRPSASTTISGLYNATSPNANYNPASADNGFFVNFQNAGEKAVNAPTTIGGFTYIGTSTPPTPSTATCTNLGTARGYQIGFLTGATESVVFDNQGLPPSPVAGLVNVDVGGVERPVPFCLGCGNPAGAGGAGAGGADASSSIGGTKPPIPVPPLRKRLYWYIEKHDN